MKSSGSLLHWGKMFFKWDDLVSRVRWVRDHFLLFRSCIDCDMLIQLIKGRVPIILEDLLTVLSFFILNFFTAVLKKEKVFAGFYFGYVVYIDVGFECVADVYMKKFESGIIMGSLEM